MSIAELDEELDGVDEMEAFDDHDEVDRVEVLFTAKAASKIGSRIRRGIELLAAWTEKTDVALGDLHGHGEDFEDPRDRQIVSQRPQKFGG